MRVLTNYINGAKLASSSPVTSPVIDPVTGLTYCLSPKSTPADVEAAMKAAADAFVTWKTTTPSERQMLLLKIADAFDAHADELVNAECKNCGKPKQLTLDEEMGPMIDQIRFFAGASRHLEGKSAGCYMKEHFSMIVREPVGVCAQVTPWNYVRCPKPVAREPRATGDTSAPHSCAGHTICELCLLTCMPVESRARSH